MTTTYQAVLTPAGRAKIMAALASGSPVQLTQIAVGDGNGNPIDPTTNTSLAREVYRNNISSLTVDATDRDLIYAEVIIPSNAGGWAVREIGVFDSTNTLIVIANFPDTYKPVVADGSTRDMVIRVAMKMANSSAVTLVVDTSIVSATRAWVVNTITPAFLFPGGTTGQVLAKASNANGDTVWKDATAALNIVVNALKEVQTAAASQTVFTMATVTTVGLAVYVEGSREDDFTILNATQIQLSRPMVAGARVLFVQNEVNEPFQLVKKMRFRAYFHGQT